MPKERGQQNQSPGQSSPPLASIQEQRPQKKFSLASAFPLSSPNRAHHYRQQQQPRGALRNPDSNAAPLGHEEANERAQSSPIKISSLNREAKIQLRKGSVIQTRKLSAPVDYRDSGVYLGEIDRDPVVDMWSTIRERDDSTLEAEEPVVLASSAPVSLKAQVKKRFRRHPRNR